MKQKLLIVDDERGIVDMMRDYFTPQYQVLTAGSGQEAVRQAEQQPDLILLDLNLPGKSGFQLCAEIREFSDVPIIFVTGRTDSMDEITVIVAIDEDNSQTGLSNLLHDICKECRRVLEVAITAGVGYSCETLPEISHSYESAVDALGYRAIVGTGRPIYINDVEPVGKGKLQFHDRDEEELVAAIKFGTPDKIDGVIRALSARMEDAKVHTRQYQVYMLSIANCMIRLMQQYDLDIDVMFDASGQYAEVLEGICRREEFADRITVIACRMNEVMNRERDNTTRRVIQEAKEYIREHYADPELSVEMLCRHLHMSPAYFSTVFKKETGQAYVNYLTEVRLKKAVELLNETDDKTYMIAQKVGYQEQNYFSYVFKKRYGVSPTKYRGTQADAQ